MNDMIVLVNRTDEIIGYGEKLETHQAEYLHRAFSIFLFSPEDGKLLIQRRAFGKYHSGGMWSNSCCSHPRKGQPMLAVLNQRLLDELNYGPNCKQISELSQPMEDSFVFCGKFGYYAQFDGLAEHEIDHVFVLFTKPSVRENIRRNPQEAVDMQWIDLEELVIWVQNNPDAFSVWFCPAFKLAYQAISDELRRRKCSDAYLKKIDEMVNSLSIKPNVSVFEVK